MLLTFWLNYVAYYGPILVIVVFLLRLLFIYNIRMFRNSYIFMYKAWYFESYIYDRVLLFSIIPTLMASLLILLLTIPPAYSFEFLSDDLVIKVNEGLAATNQPWRFQKHDCGILTGSDLYNCRNILQNSIEMDAISVSSNEKANEVVLIWNGIDLFKDSFAFAMAMVTKVCSPKKVFNEISKNIATILPRLSEKNLLPNDIPRRSIIIDGIEYAATVQPNGFLMVTVKDTGVSEPK